MTAEMPAAQGDHTARASSTTPTSVDSAGRPPGKPSSDFDVATRMVAAVGGVLRWRGAMHWEIRPAHATLVVADSWQNPDSKDVVSPPAWLADIDPTSLHERRAVWRAGDQDPSGHAAVAVPVRVEGVVAGILGFFGTDIPEPDDATTTLLEAVATLLGEGGSPDHRTPPAPDSGHGTLEQAIALVDVFAYTVLVPDTGQLQWRYFGPNSDAVFGGTVSSKEPLTTLVRRHAHPDDLLAVQAFERAASTGQPLEIEMRIVGLDKATRWVSWRTVPRHTEGRLYVDGVATDVSARRSLGQTRRDLMHAHAQYARQVDMMREHALAVRDANDNVLQRIFAAGLRLQMLNSRLNDVEAHAATTIAFQLDQAATDLREIILDLNEVIKATPEERDRELIGRVADG